jgi:LysM repeat protein
MKSKDNSGPKIPTKQPNINQKKKSKTPESTGIGGSLLKKNEFTIIIAGALVVTIVVFFFFFRSSGPSTGSLPSLSNAGSFGSLEKRIGDIESALEKLQAGRVVDSDPATTISTTKLAPVQQKVSRLEASVSVKFDSLIERMGKLEQQISALKKKSYSPTPVKKNMASVKSLEKSQVKTALKKPAVTSEKKDPIFHTVQKGETLWGISQKYKTSVANLRKLNKLSTTAKIYPGTNIMVR